MNNPLISVVTVSYNAVTTIERTILSVISQTYPNIEYIIIDGGSTDGTVDIIKKYADRVAYWVSEPDKGIYDAMNKGIKVASGEWINFMNCGDSYYSVNVLESIFMYNTVGKYDVIFGHSMEILNDKQMLLRKANYSLPNLPPSYRHGASFVRTSIHKVYTYQLNKSHLYSYALDYHCIWRMYKAGYSFKLIDVLVLNFLKEGISNNAFKNKWLNTLIEYDGKKSLSFWCTLLKKILVGVLRKFPFLKGILLSLFYFFSDYILNRVVQYVPIWLIRKNYIRILGGKISTESRIDMGCCILGSKYLRVDRNTHINRNCLLDARGKLIIGKRVSISHKVSIITADHDAQSVDFSYRSSPVIIGDYVWIGVNATILKGVTVGEGAVVCAGAIVIHDVSPYSIVAGIPAKEIGKRNNQLNYIPLNNQYYWPSFT